jgi:hypothetical protein
MCRCNAPIYLLLGAALILVGCAQGTPVPSLVPTQAQTTTSIPTPPPTSLPIRTPVPSIPTPDPTMPPALPELPVQLPTAVANRVFALLQRSDPPLDALVGNLT